MTPTETATAWLASFDQALSAGDIDAAAELFAEESYWLGGIAVAAGAFYAFAHSARVWLLGPPDA